MVHANSALAAYAPEPYRSRKEVVGRALHELSQTDGAAQLETLLKQVAETGEPISYEQYASEGREGSPTYWNWTITRIDTPEDAGEKLVMLTAHEVTELVLARHAAQQAAEEARATAEELDTVISQMVDGVIIFDVEGHIKKMKLCRRSVIGYTMDSTGAPSSREFYAISSPSGQPFEPDATASRRALAGETV